MKEASSSPSTGHISPPYFLILLISTAFLGFVTILFDLSPIILPAGVVLITSCLLISRPVAFLSLLIIIRMSLDIFGDTFSLALGKYTSLSLSQALGIEVAFFGSVALFLLRKNLRKFPLVSPFLVVLVWGTLSLIISIDTGTTAREILRVFDMFLLFALTFVAVKNQDDFRTILSATFTSSIIPILVGAYQFIFNIGFQDESVSIPRIFGTFSHPNIFSLYLSVLVALAMLFFLVFAQNIREKIFAGTAAFIYAAMLFATYTRIAWISLFVFFFVLAVLQFRKMLLPLIFIPLFLFLAIAPFQNRFLDSFRSSPDSSITWRLTLWKDAIDTTLANNNVFLGSGMNTFPLVSESIRGMSQGPSNDPHNDFVKFFVEGGIVGLFVFIFFLGKVTSSLLLKFLNAKNQRERNVFLVLFALFVSLITASFSDNIFKNTPVQWIFWITFGAALGAFSRTLTTSFSIKKSAIPALQK